MVFNKYDGLACIFTLELFNHRTGGDAEASTWAHERFQYHHALVGRAGIRDIAGRWGLSPGSTAQG